MSDDPKRLRLRAVPPAVSVPPPPGAPALLGRVTTTTAAALGPGKFFKVRRYTIAGAEVEGGAATLTAGPTAPVYVLARGGTPETGALVVASQVPYRWVWSDPHPDPPCDYVDLCVRVPGAGEDAVVTLDRIWVDTAPDPDVEHVEPYDIGTAPVLLGDDLRFCVRVPITLADPTAAPTVDPDGGGASGGTLGVGAYVALYSWVTRYGETMAGPPSAAFQVGVPDPSSYPPAAALSVGDTGARSGALATATYSVKHTYSDGAGGETVAGPAATVRFGLADPADTLSTVGIAASGGLLAAGTYKVKWAATDGTHFTTPRAEADATVGAGEIYGLRGLAFFTAPGTGLTAWLSDDAGATWRRYLHNVNPSFDPLYHDYTIRFDGPFAGTVGDPPAGNTFPELDPRVTFPASWATLRPNAAGINLYIARVSPATPYRLYQAGIATASFDLTAAFPGSGAAPPTTNTTAKNIPEVTFAESPDAASSRVYARPANPAAPSPCVRYEAASSPRSLTGGVTANLCPPTFNSTHNGTWRWTVSPTEYSWEDTLGTTHGSDSRTFTVAGKCYTKEIVFTCDPLPTLTLGVRPHGILEPYRTFASWRARVRAYSPSGEQIGGCNLTLPGTASCDVTNYQPPGTLLTVTAEVVVDFGRGPETQYGVATQVSSCAGNIIIVDTETV